MQKEYQLIAQNIITMLKDDLEIAISDKFDCLKLLNESANDHKKLRTRIKMLNTDIDYLNLQIKELSIASK